MGFGVWGLGFRVAVWGCRGFGVADFGGCGFRVRGVRVSLFGLLIFGFGGWKAYPKP